MTKKETPHFEQSLKSLQKIVEAMESGELSLEKSLAEFEKGVKLIRQCQKSLETAEQKVQILLKDQVVDFNHDAD